MNKQGADKIISEYVKKLFGFSVSRLSRIDEAEELVAEITLQVYESLLRQDNISNIDGYIWRTAKNVYARYIDGRNRITVADGLEYIPDSRDFTAEIMNSESYGILRREITYLSEIQREIIVLHYFHDKKVREISAILSIPENTVKWHLACSRKELRIGMEKTRTTGNLGTEPIRLTDFGHNGCPGSKGDTADFLAKSLTQNIAYAAYHQPRTINEIAEELGVNPIFVRDEVDVLEEYGFMDKLAGEKYRTNIYIKIPNKTSYEIFRKINAEYSKLFAEKYFAPVLEKITEIPDWIHVPDNDINLLKWCLVCFMAQKLNVADGTDDRFYVKRPDGGNYIAHAALEVKTDWSIKATDENIYWFCGHMWRENTENNIKSWQFNCHWAGREGLWRDNRNSDYDKLYFWLKGQLPDTINNAEDYARLLDKGYLIKTDNGYKCNLILCDNLTNWWKFIPEANEEALSLAAEYVNEAMKANLYGQPEHMHDLIEHYSRVAACNIHTRVMKILLDMGVLKLPTEEQKKGLCTVMFTGE